MQKSKGVYTAWVLLSPAEDVAGAWIAHALDFDVVTHGNSPEHAIRMVIEAVGMVLEDDIAERRDPYARRAPAEFWEQLHFIMEHGDVLPMRELMEKAHASDPTSGCQIALSMFFKESWKPLEDSVPSYRVPLGMASRTIDAHPC